MCVFQKTDIGGDMTAVILFHVGISGTHKISVMTGLLSQFYVI